jgi:hypothetical protein
MRVIGHMMWLGCCCGHGLVHPLVCLCPGCVSLFWAFTSVSFCCLYSVASCCYRALLLLSVIFVCESP